MAVWVHKDGESALIKPERLQSHLAAGWSVEKESKEPQGEQKEEPEEDEITTLRKQAKVKGIRGWQRMSVETLREKLNGC